MNRGKQFDEERSFGDFGKVGKIVTVLMGLGGGVLLNAAPPAHYLVDDPSRARQISHGIASLLVFGLYFFITGWASVKAAASRRRWFKRGTAALVLSVVSLVAYGAVRGELVVDAEGGDYMVGLWRDRGWIEANEGKDWVYWSNKKLFEGTPWGFAYEEIWRGGSRIAAYGLLQGLYVMGLLSLFGGVFCLWTGFRGRADGTPNGGDPG